MRHLLISGSKRKSKPRHGFKISVKTCLVTVTGDKNDLKFFALSLELVVESGQLGCEASARRAPTNKTSISISISDIPMSRKIKSNDICVESSFLVDWSSLGLQRRDVD